jgi:gliding motility-associated protein GldE
LDLEPNFNFANTEVFLLLSGCVLIVLLLFCFIIISGTKVVAFSLSKKEILELEQQKNSKSKMVAILLEKPKKLKATLVIATNFIIIGVVFLYSFISEKVFITNAPTFLKFVLEVAFVTFLLIFFGEILSKGYATRNTIQFTNRVVNFIFILNKLLSPVSFPLRAVSRFLHKKLGKQKNTFSVDQLSQALELTTADNTSTEEQKILEGIVTFGNTDTKQVMRPRIDIFGLEMEETFLEIYPKIIEKGYSRIPVYKDNIDQIVGILFVKDLLPHIDSNHFDWKTLLREPFFVPENKKLDNLLKEFQSMKNHLAIVVDEYGGTSGLVSLEDVIEEIVGDISDEFDDEQINFSQIDDKNFIFEGKTNLKDFYRIIAVDESVFETNKGEAETLAGFILEILGNFPKKEQKIVFENCLFTIETVDKKRIKQIKVTIE